MMFVQTHYWLYVQPLMMVTAKDVSLNNPKRSK